MLVVFYSLSEIVYSYNPEFRAILSIKRKLLSLTKLYIIIIIIMRHKSGEKTGRLINETLNSGNLLMG